MTQTDIALKPTIIRFDSVLLARLRATADRNGVSVAHLVRLIVAEWFESKDKANQSTIDIPTKA
jgi:hypothetical protein